MFEFENFESSHSHEALTYSRDNLQPSAQTSQQIIEQYPLKTIHNNLQQEMTNYCSSHGLLSSSPLRVPTPNNSHNTVVISSSPQHSPLRPSGINGTIPTPLPNQSAFEEGTFSEKKRNRNITKQCPAPPSKSPLTSKKIKQSKSTGNFNTQISLLISLPAEKHPGSDTLFSFLLRFFSMSHFQCVHSLLF